MPSTIDTKYLRLLRSKPALRTSHHSAILCGSVHAAMGELLPGENSSSQNHSHRKAPWLRRPISMSTSAQRDIKMSESAERKKQGKKKVSNEEWISPVDPDSRIVKMKDGRTHLGYKAEHVVDLKSEYILSADVVHGTDSDSKTLTGSLVLAQTNLVRAGSQAQIKEVAADKGYHANQTLVDCNALGVRTYTPERETGPRRWTDKPPEMETAYRNNGRRVKRAKGKRLQRIRSELLERSFAHVCETGGARRTWLRGLEKINKRYQIHTAARNLGLL